MSKTCLLEIMVKQKRTCTKGSPPSILTTDADGQDKTIKAGRHLRILGGNLQNNLSWQAHVTSGEKALLPIVRQKLGALRHIGKKSPKS